MLVFGASESRHEGNFLFRGRGDTWECMELFKLRQVVWELLIVDANVGKEMWRRSSVGMPGGVSEPLYHSTAL
jgi:hypothetical protein